jgi:hypothetical protein
MSSLTPSREPFRAIGERRVFVCNVVMCDEDNILTFVHELFTLQITFKIGRSLMISLSHLPYMSHQFR